MNEDEQCTPDVQSETGNCPLGFTLVDYDETGTCYPIVIEKIDNRIKNILTTMPSPATCNISQQKNVDLGESPLGEHDSVILAVFAPCQVIGGEAILSLPQDNANDLNLVAVRLNGDEVTEPVVLDTQKIQDIDKNRTLYRIDFREKMLGLTHGGEKLTIQHTNALALWNNSTKQVNLNNNSITLNATLSCSFCGLELSGANSLKQFPEFPEY